jgi:hypothetical protein
MPMTVPEPQRYQHFAELGFAEYDDGEWVHYYDHKAVVELLQKEIARLEARIRAVQ